ncbi:MAG: hypothetical protein JO149_07150, partial [Gammaproteobacteria bacterium]|nr:hypothetical protein [Gammaproteobacteria bacterium]
MSEHLQKFFSFGIQQALYEKDTSQGHLAVYQTSPFGLLLTLNGQALISESDSFFSYEMMAHPALFTHSKPQQIALLGNHFGILAEVLKHPSVVSVSCILENRDIQEAVATYFSHCLVTQTDSRVTYATE